MKRNLTYCACANRRAIDLVILSEVKVRFANFSHKSKDPCKVRDTATVESHSLFKKAAGENSLTRLSQILADRDLSTASFDSQRESKRSAQDDKVVLMADGYSTVTDFARFRGWSTSQPRRTAMW